MMELVDRAWPSVNQEQRHRRRPAAAHVPIVEVSAIDCADELRICVQRRFVLAPVIVALPVLAQFPDVVDAGAVRPRLAGQRLRPARARQPLAQIIEHTVANIDAKLSWWHWCQLSRWPHMGE